MPKAKKAEPKRHQGGEIEEVLNSFAEVMSKLMIDDHQEQIAALDLTLLQGQVLRVLRRGAVPTGKLASELQISASAVTQLTDRLIRKELIERQSVTGDRRCVVVGLSSKGKTLIDDFRKRRTVLFSESLSHLSERKHSQVVQAMKLVIGALENSKKSDNKQDS
ncbi:MAG TPA: MarR family transcriptional regulator [Pyrinomonadaceae bacterium]|jgi:DNA-binding MarR family transcriptional regulator|nr:MarR family transcriptional regulator [Pyrinomonadaceae bacterium]